MRPRTLAIVTIAGFLLGADLGAPPQRQWSARSLIGVISGYQKVLSPLLAAQGVRCRFEPSCSRYAKATLARRGAAVGVARAAWRLARCGPWTPAGTIDPPD